MRSTDHVRASDGVMTTTIRIALGALLFSGSAFGIEWSTNELHFQYGALEAPTFASGKANATRVITLQHASGWPFGDVFLFIDYLDDDEPDGFNDDDFYGEIYLNLSLSKIFGRKIGFGPIRDIGVLGGLNRAHDAEVVKYLPGMRFSWDLPGMRFLNTDFAAYIDDSDGFGDGGAPSETDSFWVDVNWAYPFSLGNHDFSIQGHVEYVDGRRNEFGGDVSWWVLGQPQFRYDLGKTLFDKPEHLFLGVEWQFWINKLGDRDTDENAVQALVVFRL